MTPGYYVVRISETGERAAVPFREAYEATQKEIDAEVSAAISKQWVIDHAQELGDRGN